jgi:hypothetical protein
MLARFLIVLLPLSLLYSATSPCDLNTDGQVNVVDVQQATNQALGIAPCDGGDLDLNGQCDVVDVQRFINSAMGQECNAAQPPSGNGTSVTSYGVKCDGSTNDGAALQKAFSDRANWASNTLVFPAGKVCMSGTKLRLESISGWTVNGNGSTIKATNGLATTGSALLWVIRSSNGTINNLDVDGNRANRTCTSASQGGGNGGNNFQVGSSQNITVNDMDSNNSCHDGFNVRATSPGDTATFPKNITFVNPKANNSWRIGGAVIEGWEIRFLGTCSGGFNGTCTCQMRNSNGGPVEAGIDWEPNPDQSASPGNANGMVDGCLIEGNKGAGYQNHSLAGACNLTLRNSIVRSNQHDVAQAPGTVFENNYFGPNNPNNPPRFGRIYISRGQVSGSCKGTTTTAGRATEVKNNFSDGQPLVGSDSGARSLVWYGNFGDGSARFTGNTMTNLGIAPTGDWCHSGVAGGASTTQNNKISGTTVNGCP